MIALSFGIGVANLIVGIWLLTLIDPYDSPSDKKASYLLSFLNLISAALMAIVVIAEKSV